MKFDDIIKAMGAFGEGGTAPRAEFGAGPRFVPPDGTGGFVGPISGAMEGIRRAQERADEVAARTEKVVQNPVGLSWGSRPSGKPRSG
jgi:hypothetical protein